MQDICELCLPVGPNLWGTVQRAGVCSQPLFVHCGKAECECHPSNVYKSACLLKKSEETKPGII